MSQELARELGILPLQEIPPLALCRIQALKVPYSFAKRHLLLPLYQEGKSVVVALCDPLLVEPVEELRFLLKEDLHFVWMEKEALLQLIESCYNCEKEVVFQGDTEGKGASDAQWEEDLLEEQQEAPIVAWLHAVIREGLQKNASDIHFEPFEEQVVVRLRIDGVLHPRHFLPKHQQAALITRLKVMARLDIAEQRLPQDGRIKVRLADRPIDIRISTIPTVLGERVVLRLLDQSQVSLGLKKLSMPPSLLEKFQTLLSYPEGMILVTGPTGSGKTTTLYSAISDLSSKERNIMTIEDPVEYKLKGISQMQVQPKIGLDFATGLKHLLRQDPDILLVGEIRDQETAQIAVQASLTGHLVLATLHTNDAPSAIVRLMDMGIEPYLLAASLVGVVAQRLVRLLCPYCKEIQGGVFQARGCIHCFENGYRGRRGVYELFVISEQIKRKIAAKADLLSLREMAVEEGMEGLLQNAMRLIEEGETTSVEVKRVIH